MILRSITEKSAEKRHWQSPENALREPGSGSWVSRSRVAHTGHGLHTRVTGFTLGFNGLWVFVVQRVFVGNPLEQPEIGFWPPGIESPSENAHRGSGLWVVRVTGLSLGFNGFRVSMGSWVNELAGNRYWDRRKTRRKSHLEDRPS